MNEQSQSVSAEEEYEVLPCPSCDTRYRIAASEGLQDEDPLHCSKCDTLFNRLKARAIAAGDPFAANLAVNRAVDHTTGVSVP